MIRRTGRFGVTLAPGCHFVQTLPTLYKGNIHIGIAVFVVAVGILAVGRGLDIPEPPPVVPILESVEIETTETTPFLGFLLSQ